MIDLHGFRFQEPLWLLAALAGVLVVLAAVWRERQGCAVALPGLATRSRLPATWRVRLRFLPAVLAGLGLALAAVALARPQHGSLRQNVTTEGIDIVVALDVSGSMAAEDFQPRNRLEVAKKVVSDFVQRRTQDRVGLVVFAAKALTKAPPTTDTALLLRQLDDVRLDMLPDGTAIGSGLATALARLRRSQAKSKVIVLVTDGANNTGEIDPSTATDLARAMQVRVYTVGVGKGGRVPITVKVRDPNTGAVATRRLVTEVEIDEALLRSIASATGGEFFRATDPASLQTIFARIDALEKSEIKLATYQRYRELFYPWLVAAAALLGAAALTWAGGLRVRPV
ncbi:MAG TPA: VWA domain-containing protein [Thermoanaerobaculaceae bacterium]|nr:VWA domain-containing protein [Thermoanaerobaculaceae bacterium]HRS15331.1 VWA domain-containing protein [Thermoanaerobaculaceae bacterium]